MINDTNMKSDLSFFNQVRQKTSHSFQFDDNYDSLCYKFYLQDTEEQNLRIETERIEPPVGDYTDDTKTPVRTQGPINCYEIEYPITSSVSSTPVLNIKSHIESEESLKNPLLEKKLTPPTLKERTFLIVEHMNLNPSIHLVLKNEQIFRRGTGPPPSF